MKLRTKYYDLNKILGRMAKQWGTEAAQGCQELFFDLPKKHGSGTVQAFDFEDGMQCFLFKGQLAEMVEWHFKMETDSPFLMFFMVSGEVELDFADKGQYSLEALGTVFAAHPPNSEQNVKILPENDTLFLLLKIERQVYIDHIDCFSKPVTEELSSIFLGETAVKEFKGRNDYGIQSAGFLQEILNDEQEGLTRATFVEAKTLDLFSLQLRQWEEEVDTSGSRPHFRPEDVEKLNNARSILIKDLQNAPTIKELAKRSGLNRQKLKQGFKKMFGKTINEFLRNERLRTSRQMLSHSQPIIREIASKVGYENPSYFARRFREKYGLYPSEYMKILYKQSEEEEE